MRQLFSALFIGAFVISSFGQEAESDSKNFKDHFFLGFVSSYYIDFVSSPLQIVDFSRELQGGFTTPDTAIPFQTRYIALFSIGVEARYNFYEHGDNLAFAISMPVTMGFGEAIPQNEDVEGASGYSNIQIPMLLKTYYGTHSTYRNSSEFGVSAGAGFEYNKLGLIATDGREKVKDANKGWIMPVFSLSAHFWRNNAPIEINFKYGKGANSDYSVNKHGQALIDGKRTTRASSTKLSFVYLFN